MDCKWWFTFCFSLIFQTLSIPALFFRPGFLFCPRGNVRSVTVSVSLAMTCCVLAVWRLTSESMLTAARATAGSASVSGRGRALGTDRGHFLGSRLRWPLVPRCVFTGQPLPGLDRTGDAQHRSSPSTEAPTTFSENHPPITLQRTRTLWQEKQDPESVWHLAISFQHPGS